MRRLGRLGAESWNQWVNIIVVVSFPLTLRLYEVCVRHIGLMRFLFGMPPPATPELPAAASPPGHRENGLGKRPRPFMSRGLFFVGRQCWGVVAGGENTDGQDLRIQVRVWRSPLKRGVRRGSVFPGGNRLCRVAGRLPHPPICATMIEASALCASPRRWPRRWGPPRRGYHSITPAHRQGWGGHFCCIPQHRL